MFLRFKILKLSSESQNLPEIGCLRVQSRFKINFHGLKMHNFLLNKKSASLIFSMILAEPLVGESDIFFKSEFRLF